MRVRISESFMCPYKLLRRVRNAAESTMRAILIFSLNKHNVRRIRAI